MQLKNKLSLCLAIGYWIVALTAAAAAVVTVAVMMRTIILVTKW
jgi:hypothetical protein